MKTPRSWLFLPGDNVRTMRKALGSDAYALTLYQCSARLMGKPDSAIIALQTQIMGMLFWVSNLHLLILRLKIY